MPSPAVRRTAGALVALALLLSACGKSQPSPNVLLIVADDLGYNDLAINNGNAEIHTPSLDALAREGVRFTRHYADAVCSPARAALLTGQQPARLGFLPNGRGISPQLLTLAEVLRDNGYHTMHIGKWHIGHTVRAAWPDRQGFDHWFGFLHQWFLAGKHENGELVVAPDRHEEPWLMRDGDAGARYHGHVDDILTEEATRQIHELGQAGKPWFINLWYYLPHAPITPSPAFASRYPDTIEGRYRAMLEQLDSNVGAVLEALADSGQADSTIVVLVSDNGAATALPDSNAPFFGTKTTFYEGGVRTPLLIRWPGGAGAGTVRDDLAAIYDIYPTIVARLGIDVPDGLDGRDLGIAAVTDTAPRELFWETNAAGHFGYSVLRDARWRLYKIWPWAPWDMPAQLFDVNATTPKPEDLSAQKPELQAELEQTWRTWHRTVHTPDLRFERDSSGAGKLTGLDFLRTPGFGGFSFALAFDAGYTGRLAEQRDVWSMTAGNGGEIVAAFGPHRVSGHLAPEACHSAIVSARFSRRISALPGARDYMRLALFLDGELRDTLEADTHIDDSHFAEPTLVGHAQDAAAAPKLGEPLLLTVPVEDSDIWHAPEMHAALCAKLRDQPGRQTK